MYIYTFVVACRIDSYRVCRMTIEQLFFSIWFAYPICNWWYPVKRSYVNHYGMWQCGCIRDEARYLLFIWNDCIWIECAKPFDITYKLYIEGPCNDLTVSCKQNYFKYIQIRISLVSHLRLQRLTKPILRLVDFIIYLNISLITLLTLECSNWFGSPTFSW